MPNLATETALAPAICRHIRSLPLAFAVGSRGNYQRLLLRLVLVVTACNRFLEGRRIGQLRNVKPRRGRREDRCVPREVSVMRLSR